MWSNSFFPLVLSENVEEAAPHSAQTRKNSATDDTDCPPRKKQRYKHICISLCWGGGGGGGGVEPNNTNDEKLYCIDNYKQLRGRCNKVLTHTRVILRYSRLKVHNNVQVNYRNKRTCCYLTNLLVEFIDDILTGYRLVDKDCSDACNSKVRVSTTV